MRYILLNTNDEETVNWSIEEILEEVNRDRTETWIPYDEGDWAHGLREWTSYVIIGTEK